MQLPVQKNIMYNTFLAQLQASDTVLTPNRRLAAFLRKQYAQQQQTIQKKQSWENPDILPLSSWLERCWEETQVSSQGEPMVLLTPLQEQFIWETIVRASEAGKQLLQPIATAKMAQQAWQLTKQWQIDSEPPSYSQTEDTRVWQHWAKDFQSYCQSKHWLDPNCLVDWLLPKIEQSKLPVAKRLFLLGFDEISPQYQCLFKVLSLQGVRIEYINCAYPSPDIQRIAFADPGAELDAMARWAAQQNQAGITSIACVIPNLTELRSQAVATFTDVFATEALLPGSDQSNLPFNISAGVKFKDFALIHTALLILSLEEEISLLDLGVLLRSPYLGWAEEEMTTRARLDAQLRSYGEPRLSLKQILIFAKKSGVNKFAELLQAYLQLRLKYLGKLLPPHEWANAFSQLLIALQWPGERTLDSTEHQIIEGWSNLLSTFAKLSIVSSPMSNGMAIAQLKQIATTQEFQPKSPPVAVQILGILEAAGLSFQRAWVMGLHDLAWPPSPNPNPFIPYSLQQKLGLPHSSNQRELRYCRDLTHRLTHSAQEVILSYPQAIEDRNLRPSPLIQNFKAKVAADLNLPTEKSYAQIIYASAAIELLTDENAPSLSIEEKISGGASIFKDQAACPFRAFARFRLGAKALELPEAGLSLLERGSLLHKSLEAIWNVIGNHQQLVNLTADELQHVVEQGIEASLIQFIRKRPLTFKARFTAIEKSRLTRLLCDWLEVEKKRPPFSVKSIEQAITTSVAEIPLTLRVDRIDQLASGELLIIDYKTGMPSITDWLGDRPNEPQLPLYCVTNQEPVSGLLFAQVRSDSKQFKGLVANEKIDIQGTYTFEYLKDEHRHQSWDALIGYWQKVLVIIGQQFYQGFAKVDPKEGSKTCQTCDLHALCRINEKVESVL